MKIFCWLGLHWRMKIMHRLFIDKVSRKEVFATKCPCWREWMIDDIFGFPLFKVERGLVKTEKG